MLNFPVEQMGIGWLLHVFYPIFGFLLQFKLKNEVLNDNRQFRNKILKVEIYRKILRVANRCKIEKLSKIP